MPMRGADPCRPRPSQRTRPPSRFFAHFGFKVVGMVGAGGFADVYLAIKAATGKKVALKRFRTLEVPPPGDVDVQLWICIPMLLFHFPSLSSSPLPLSRSQLSSPFPSSLTAFLDP